MHSHSESNHIRAAAADLVTLTPLRWFKAAETYESTLQTELVDDLKGSGTEREGLRQVTLKFGF